MVCKEVLLVRQATSLRPTVLVYDVVEYGRHFYTSLVFASNPALALHHCSTSEDDTVVMDFLRRPMKPAPSLVITRNLSTSLGLETYIPDRLLYGVLPEALIDEFVFWQSKQSRVIHGYQRQATTGKGTSKDLFQLKVSLDSSGKATITRLPLLFPDTVSKGDDTHIDDSHMMGIGMEDRVDSEGVQHELLRFAETMEGEKENLCNLLLRLDHSSHILIWTRVGEREIDLVELPRLGLTFQAQPRE